MDAEPLVDCGAVVVVVVVGVVSVVEADGLAAVEVEVVEGVVVAVVPDLDAVVADEAWVVLPEATSTPTPTAAADATTPMPMVARRTRATARSRAWAAERGDGWRGRGCGAMAWPFWVGPRPAGPAAWLLDGTIRTAQVESHLRSGCAVPVNPATRTRYPVTTGPGPRPSSATR